MHFVCSPFGSSGDVHPMLALAVALKARGHDVTFLNNGYFDDLVRDCQLPSRQLGTKEEFLTLASAPELWKPFEALQYIYREGVAHVMRQHYDMLEEYAGDRQTITVSNIFGFGARVAQEKLGIPLVTLHLQPSVMWSRVDPPQVAGLVGPRWWKNCLYDVAERLVIDAAVCPTLNAWRTELNLPPVRRVTRWWHSPWCVACLFPDWFAPPQSDWPANLLQTGFPLWDDPADARIPQEVVDFIDQGDPPIVFTPGSANVFGKAFFNAAVETCQRLQRRGLLLTRFANQLPHPLPDLVKHVEWVPFGKLLPRCAALVHHGGVGSMSQAMAAGIPQLILALAHDQFDNGKRVERLGIGRLMNHSSVSGRRMARMLSDLLTTETARHQSQQLASKLAGSDASAEMAAAIEAFAVSRGFD